MPVAWELEGSNTIVCRISGQLKKSDHDALLTKIGPALKDKGKKQNILVILENFEGWEVSTDWNDSPVADDNDQFIHKFAIVGDDKWRDLVAAFTLQGFRSMPIEYFIEEDAARKWLALD